jgi:hypothetical protein
LTRTGKEKAMKKFIVVLLVLLLASPCFGSVGIKQGTSHIHQGEAVDIDVGDAGFFDGSTLYLGYTAINGTSNVTSGPTALLLTYKNVNQGFAGSNVDQTLANGTVGQIIILTVSANSGSYVWTVTPATARSFTSVKLSAVGSFAVLMFINTEMGWSIVDSAGATIK